MATERQDAHVHLSDPAQRASIEAQRGIKRDEHGAIIRTSAWRKERVTLLDEKIATFKARIKNAEAEKKAHLAALKK